MVIKSEKKRYLFRIHYFATNARNKSVPKTKKVVGHGAHHLQITDEFSTYLVYEGDDAVFEIPSEMFISMEREAITALEVAQNIVPSISSIKEDK